MQMPIVDGLTSAKMIRSYEKSHPSHLLSQRASLNDRVPIIAVSASLIEKERQTYIDAGFAGWILKPISFHRLSEIMKGIVDRDVRRANLYRQGVWEYGGWFDDVQKDVFTADTTPSGEPPMQAPGASAPREGVKIAAASEDPNVKEENGSEQSAEQQRLNIEQTEQAPRAATMPEVRSPDKGDEGSAEMHTMRENWVGSPAPMTPEPEQ